MILKRGNSPEVADLLEVYDLCLLLGFQGEYRLKAKDVKGKDAIPAIIAAVGTKLRMFFASCRSVVP